MRYFKHPAVNSVYRWDEKTLFIWFWKNTKWVECEGTYAIHYINKLITSQHWTELSDEDLFIEMV